MATRTRPAPATCHRRRTLGFLIALAAVTTGGAAQVCAQPVPPSAGIWHSDTAEHALADASRRTLVTSLRRITGLPDIVFSADGRIEIGTGRRGGGSRIAEDVLRTALASGDVFVIQDHSGSPSVTFGQIESLDYINDQTGRRVRVWWVRLDFDDFRTVHASKRVRAAFDPGFVLLHELLHALGHRDDLAPGALGDCERILNGARRELGLPLRADYAAIRVAPAGIGPDARLRFEDAGPGRPDSRVRHLFFRTTPGAAGERMTTLRPRGRGRTPS
ncbi:MAG: hypothetical protein AB7I25_04405 [Vicinamibacterales bacterium]